MSNLPLVRFLISAAAHTDSVWYGSLVSYTCAHLSFCCASAGRRSDQRRDGHCHEDTNFAKRTHDVSSVERALTRGSSMPCSLGATT